MKIAVFSDIHGNYQALVAILKKIGNNYDKIIFLGDAIAIGPDSKECVKTLQNDKIVFLLGNHDLYCTRGTKMDPDLSGVKLAHHNYIEKSLGEIKLIENDNLRYDFTYNDISFSFFHYFFATNNKELYPYEHLDILRNGTYKEIYDKESSDYVFFGHNHEETYNKINNKHYYGIGSSGCTFDDKTYFYSIYIKDKNVSVKKIKVRYNRKKFINRINNSNYPDLDRLKPIFYGL